MKLKHFFSLFVSLVVATPLRAQTPLPQWTLAAARDSFVINIRGEAKGFSVLAVEPSAAGGFRVTDVTQIGTMVDQKTEILVDAKNQLTRVTQAATSRGQNLRTDLHYSKGHVKGSAVTPAKDGTQSQTIDSEIPANAVDDNFVQSMLAGLPWSESSKWIMPVFSAGKNGLTDFVLTVQGTESVTVPAGTYEAYKIDMRGDVVALNIWVSKAKPHRVLKTSPVGSPIEFVRAN
jgi:hypothetical protein